MTQLATPELVLTLEMAKTQMMESIQHAGRAGQWDRAQWMVQKAKDLDDMVNGLRQNGTGHEAHRQMLTPTQAPKPTYDKLPYYFTDSNRLVKVGPSRDGTTYEHRVTREHFDAMINRLSQIAATTKTFETPDLVNAVDIPKHEPLIVLGMLEDEKLLINVRRGRWVFVNAETFAADVQKVWSNLPRQ